MTKDNALLEALRSLATGEGSERACALVRAASARGPERHAVAPPLPIDVVARPCARDGLGHHLLRLAETLAAPGGAGSRRAVYHARWAWHCLAPDDPAAVPRVSVIIPVHDRATMVAEAVESCLVQRHRPYEIIVVDDGSPHSPADALARFGAAVTLLHLDGNRGAAAARNHGLAHARGELIHFLDSDDRLTPDAISAKLAALRAVPDAEVCYGGFCETDSAGRPCKPRIVPIAPQDPVAPVWSTRNLVHTHGFVIGAVMIARHVIDGVGPFDEWLPNLEDTRYWQRLGQCDVKIVAVDRDLLVCRLLPGSLSQRLSGGHPWDAGVALMGAIDCLRHPETWRAGWRMLDGQMGKPGWARLRDPACDFAEPFREYAITGLATLPQAAAAHGLSPRPLARVLATLLAARMRSGAAPFECALADAIGAVYHDAPAPTRADAAHWLARPLLSKEVAALLDIAAAMPPGLSRLERRALRFAQVTTPLVGPSIVRRSLALAFRLVMRHRRADSARVVARRIVPAVVALVVVGALAVAVGASALFTAIGIAAAVAIAGIGAALAMLRRTDAPIGTWMIAERLRGRAIRRTPMSLGAMGANLIDAVVAAEDTRFAEHRGVDRIALDEAIDDYLAGGRLRGASTITMQLARNLFLWRHRSLIRKALEIALARTIEATLNKPRILELYLNIAEWGDGVWGAAAVAERAFGKEPHALTLDEAALLAASLPNPRRRDPRAPDAALRRQAHVIARRVGQMRADGTAFSTTLGQPQR